MLNNLGLGPGRPCPHVTWIRVKRKQKARKQGGFERVTEQDRQRLIERKERAEDDRETARSTHQKYNILRNGTIISYYSLLLLSVATH